MTTKHIAIVTATIAPSANMTHLAIRDPLRRLAEYRQALTWLVGQNAFQGIAFIENSNFLSRPEAQPFLTEMAGKVRFISAQPRDLDPQRGKGLPEAFLIAEAMADPLFESADFATKISGRYIFRNAKSYTDGVSGGGKNVYCLLRRELTFADTRIFTFTPAFFNTYFSRNIDLIDDEKNFFIEHCVAKSVHEMLAEEGGGWALPPVRAHLQGASGSTGRRGSGAFKQRAQDVGYRLLRMMLER